MTKRTKAEIILVLVALIWGTSYVVMDIAMREIQPFTLIALRFVIATLVVVPIALAMKKLKNISKETVIFGMYLGFFLLLSCVGATLAVRGTSVSNVGFLTSMTVAFTPFLARIFNKEKLTQKTMLVVAMSVVGVGLLTLKGNFQVALGDLWALFSALTYAIVILIVEKAVSKPRVDSFQLGIFQMGFGAVFGLIVALALEDFAIPKTTEGIMALLILGVVSTGVAYIAQVMAQAHTTAVRAGVTFATQPVFAGLSAIVIAGELLSVKGYIGGALIVASLVIMSLDFGNLRIGKWFASKVKHR